MRAALERDLLLDRGMRLLAFVAASATAAALAAAALGSIATRVITLVV